MTPIAMPAGANRKALRRLLRLASVALLAMALRGRADDATEPSIARQLALEGDHERAAIEFRRSALRAERPEAKAAYFWAAAYEYGRDGKFALTQAMLDRAEDLDPMLSAEALLLRGHAATGNGHVDESVFYYQSLLDTTIAPPMRLYTERQLAAALQTAGRADEARNVLMHDPTAQDGGIRAMNAYARGSDKTPKIGGLLGMAPGLGYAYSGEYANGLRSLILNGLFLFGMLDTADNGQWGAFSIIAFFELTWYTGSIYGGVDAAHRHNRERLNGCLADIRDNAAFELQVDRLPAVSLTFTF